MIFERKSSFDRSWKSLTQVRKTKAKLALEKMVAFFAGGPKPEGLGLKKLREDFWEIRIDLKDRILFTLREEVVSLVLIGNHDEIHRAPKVLIQLLSPLRTSVMARKSSRPSPASPLITRVSWFKKR